MSIKTLPPSLIEAVKNVLKEKAAKPDFLDVDKDGNKEEPMKNAIEDKKKAKPSDDSKKGKHPFVKMANESMNDKEDSPGVAKDAVDKHNCATHVYSKQFGEGTTLYSQHAEPDDNGNIAWYDVMFDHGIEKKVMVEDLQILQMESHMNHKKKKKG